MIRRGVPSALVIGVLLTAPCARGFEEESGFQPTLRLTDRVTTESAYRVGGDPDFSKARITTWLDSVARPLPRVTLLVSGRAWYDGIYETDQYPPAVRHEFRYDLTLREAWAHVAVSDRLDVRVGRQVLVWGDAVALFFADVFNPKDLREFITWDLSDQRIPLLALDASYTLWPDVRWEIAASPEDARTQIAPPGSDFAFRQLNAPAGVAVRQEPRTWTDFDPERGRLGTRLAAYVAGLEGSLFYLAGREEVPTFQIQTTATPTLIDLRPVAPLLHRIGGTLAYSTMDWVLRAEGVVALKKQFQTDPTQTADGLVGGSQVDYVLSATRRVLGWDANLQFFETYRVSKGVHPTDPEHETSGSVQILRDLWDARLEPSLLVISAFDRPSAWVRPALVWKMTDTFSARIGADFFVGRDDTFFGQFEHASRVTLGITGSLSQFFGVDN